ncbi:hypothetical protein NDU88_000774 [Pleurodeles waltl]|uniref:Uncharacterized protein n=1 Tax=Pleurodeles waltl TaxID=8319 RepID=A0AAV7VUH4_PLEWA|nr:hypothetical protein NDU88_000774 [Pleurodeles waltl]
MHGNPYIWGLRPDIASCHTWLSTPLPSSAKELSPGKHGASPGEGRQREPLCAVTWIQKEELDSLAEVNVGAGVLNCGDSTAGEGKEEDARDTPDDGRGETSGDGLRIGGRTNQRPGRRPTQAPATLGKERGQFRCVGHTEKKEGGGGDEGKKGVRTSDPPYPGGITTPDTSDPKVIQEETNPVLHPGDGRQREPLRTVTWIQKEELDSLAEVNVEARVPNCGDSTAGEGKEEDPGDTPDDGRGETSGDGLRIGARTAGRIRGPRGAQLRFRPCSGKSVAHSGAWDILTRRREVEGMKERREYGPSY